MGGRKKPFDENALNVGRVLRKTPASRIYAADVTRRGEGPLTRAESIQVSDAYSSCFRHSLLLFSRRGTHLPFLWGRRAVRAVSRLRDSRYRRPPHHDSREIELRRLGKEEERLLLLAKRENFCFCREKRNKNTK